jgi:hypothetical protein
MKKHTQQQMNDWLKQSLVEAYKTQTDGRLKYGLNDQLKRDLFRINVCFDVVLVGSALAIAIAFYVSFVL